MELEQGLMVLELARMMILEPAWMELEQSS